MDSKLYGMPLSTTQSTPSPPPPKVSSGIRAPLTIDSDIEFEYSNGGQSASANNSGIIYSSESEEGFISGEDEFETASELPFVADPNGETLQETYNVDENVGLRPFVKYPDRNFQESGNVRGYGDFRPFLATPNDNFEESSNLGELYDDSRPYLTDQDEEIVEDNFRPFVAFQNGDSLGTPRAWVSCDSDDGSVYSEILDDDGYPAAVRIPVAGDLDNFNDIPKVKVLEVEEGAGIESQLEKSIELEVVKDSISAGDEIRVVSSECEEEHIILKENDRDFKLDEVVEDEVLGVSNGDSLVGGQEHIIQNEMASERHVLDSDEEVPTYQNDTGIRKSMELDNNIRHTDHVKGEGQESEDLNLIGAEASLNHLQEEHMSPCGSLDLNLPGMGRKDATETEASINFETLHDDQYNDDGYINNNGMDMTSQDGGNEVVENRNEQEMCGMVESDDQIAASKDHSFDSFSGEYEMPGSDQGESSKEISVQDSVHSAEECLPDITQSYVMAGKLLEECNVPEPVTLDSNLVPKTGDEAHDSPNEFVAEEGSIYDGSSELVAEEEGSFLHNNDEGLTFEESDMPKNETEQLNQIPTLASSPVEEIAEDHLQMDGQFMTDSDEDVEREDGFQGIEIFDSAALAALLKAAAGAGSDGGSVTITNVDGNRIYTLDNPSSFGSTFRPLMPSTQLGHPLAESDDNLSQEAKRKLEKLQEVRVNYLRLLHRLNLSPEDPIAAQVLNRFVLASGRHAVQAFSLDSAKKVAMELEAEFNDDMNLSLNILVIGKTGVGKSATINSIFGEARSTVNAFEPTTTRVEEINGILDGVKIRILDTPGLRSSLSEQSLNRKILSSIKRRIKRFSPDVVLYVDRLDVQTRDVNDFPMLKSITQYLGSSIWSNAIIALTHAASTLPDGPFGYTLNYEGFVAQRSRVVQQLINHSVSGMHMISPGLMCPVSLVENDTHQKNGNGEILLPNGENWRSQLMLLCYSTKTISEIASLVKNQEASGQRKLFGFRVRSPPLLYFLNSLLQPNVHPKPASDQGGEISDSDIELAYSSESDQEDEDEYDQLPPFKPLRKSQIAKLSKDQRKAYLEEYDYRVKLLQKKQLREEVKRIREMKKGRAGITDIGYVGEEGDTEMESPATVAVPLPDMILPPSFDGDNPAYRYRFLEPSSRFLTRPVLDSHGWDHDCGYDGVSIENTLAIADRFPAVITAQLTKDKKAFNIHLSSSVSAKHGENGSTMAGLDIKTIGKQLAYILKSEYKLRNYKINKTATGLSVTFLGENVVTGLKLEDQIALGKRLALVGNTGITYSQRDAAYGANLEVRLRDKDYPIGQDESTLSLSAMMWRGDLLWGCNLQSQFSVGRNSKITVQAGLNNKQSGHISVRTSITDQLQIAMLALIPIAKTIYRNIFLQSSENRTQHSM